MAAPLSIPSGNYIALIGDMVRSREVTGDKRSLMQETFNRFIDRLNRRYAKHLRSQFTVTLGDEFQVLLKDPSVVPDIIWEIYGNRSQSLPHFRLGIGFGRIHTKIPRKAINLDGPAFHNARTAIQEAKSQSIMGGVFVGFGKQFDMIANGIARLMQFHVSRRSEKQLEVIDHLRHATSQVEIASKIGLSPQAVNDHKKAAGWEAYHAGEEALRQVLVLAGSDVIR